MNIKIIFKINIFGYFFFNLIHNCACNIQNSNKKGNSEQNPCNLHCSTTKTQRERTQWERAPQCGREYERASKRGRPLLCSHTHAHAIGKQQMNRDGNERMHECRSGRVGNDNDGDEDEGDWCRLCPLSAVSAAASVAVSANAKEFRLQLCDNLHSERMSWRASVQRSKQCVAASTIQNNSVFINLLTISIMDSQSQR